MKNPYRILGAAALCAALLSSCQRELEQEGIHEKGNVTKVHATFTLPEDGAVKVAYEERDPEEMDKGIKSTWEGDDYFYALKDGSEVVKFNISEGVGTPVGYFEAEATDVTAETVWTAILGKAAVANDSVIECHYEGQDGTLDNLEDVDYILIKGEGEAPEFAFNGETSDRLSYFLRIKLPAGIRYIEYCTTTWWRITQFDGTVAKGHFKCVGDMHDGHFDNVSMIDLGSESTAGQVCYIAVPAAQYGYYNDNGEFPKGIIMTFFNGGQTKSNGKVINSNLQSHKGLIGTYDLTSMTLIDRPDPSEAIDFGGAYVTINKDSRPANPELSNNNEHSTTLDVLGDFRVNSAVSPKWAPYNLGAKASPSSAADTYGEYYSWGEVSPRTSYAGDAYTYTGSHTVGSLPNFSSAQLGTLNMYEASDGASIIPVRIQRISGTKYDAARVKWGSQWRMPTIEELAMFLGETSTVVNPNNAGKLPVFTTSSGSMTYPGSSVSVNARKFTKGGVSIVFPYSGIIDNSGKRLVGSQSLLWSDTRVRQETSASEMRSPLSSKYSNDRMAFFGDNGDKASLPIRPVVNAPASRGGSSTPSVLEEGFYNFKGTVRDQNGNPIAGVTVSDGYTCVSTDANGNYTIAANPAARTMSVTVPGGYEPTNVDGTPAFYALVTVPDSSNPSFNPEVQAETQDFTLRTRTSAVSDKCTIIAVADAHVRAANLTRFQTSIDDIEETATTLLGGSLPVGTTSAATGSVVAVSLGDQLWDDLSQASAVKAKFNSLPVPVFYCIGNHDYDSSAADDYASENNFVQNFGPTNYSFDLGTKTHVIVMDNIIMVGVEDGGSASGYSGNKIMHRCGFTDAQVAWLRADIAKVPDAKNKAVVFCCHAPLNQANGGESVDDEDHDVNQPAVMSALKNSFKSVSVLSGHTHVNNNNLYRGWQARGGRNICEYTLQSLAGYWWEADITGYTGCPAGYAVFNFANGDLYARYNKTTKETADFQVRVYNGSDTYNKNSFIDEIMRGGSHGFKPYNWASPANGKFVARIWDASASNDTEDTWTVSLTYNGLTTAMTRVGSADADMIQDACAASFIFNSELGSRHANADQKTDQIWYSGTNFGSGNFTVTAVHTMPSGWSATYTATKYIGKGYKGFSNDYPYER